MAEQRYESTTQFFKIARAMTGCADQAKIAGDKAEAYALDLHTASKHKFRAPRQLDYQVIEEKVVSEKEASGLARAVRERLFSMYSLVNGAPSPVAERPKQHGVALIYASISGIYMSIPGYYSTPWETEQRGTVVLRQKDGKLKEGEAKRWEYLDELFMALMAASLAFSVRIGCADSPCPSIVVDKDVDVFLTDGNDVRCTACKPAIVHEFHRAVASSAERGGFSGPQTRLLCERMWGTIQNVIAQRSCSLTVALLDIMQRATIFDVPPEPVSAKGGTGEARPDRRREGRKSHKDGPVKSRLPCFAWADNGTCARHSNGNCPFDHPAKDKKTKTKASKKRARVEAAPSESSSEDDEDE